MSTSSDPYSLGGIIHTYQKYDPVEFPSPSATPPDLVSPAFEHMLMYGEMGEFTEEQLANAVKFDITQIAGMGASLESLRKKLLEQKRRILETYETKRVQKLAESQFLDQAKNTKPPSKLAAEFHSAVKNEQLRELQRLWYRAGDERSKFATQLLHLSERLGEKYEVDELARKYEFTGREPLTVPEALDVKHDLELIDKLLKQLEEAAKDAQLAFIDMDELSQFVDQQDLDELGKLQQQIAEQIRHLAEQQGLEKSKQGYQLTPQAYRLFQGKLLERIFSQLQESRTGRHHGPILGEGAVELQITKDYEFGDSLTNMDIPASLVNAMLRDGPQLPVRMRPDDIVIHRTRNSPKCATSVLLDMSGSMRYNGLYINVKRMALALDALIRREYPGDFLQFIEMYSIARPRHVSEIVKLLPKPVTIFDPVVRLRADMSQPDITEDDIPPHFTNIQHAMQLGRQFLQAQNTPNRQLIIITDGLPTAHFEGKHLYFLYPPDPRTEAATMREAALCKREGIVINLFLLSSWSQSEEDIRFAHRLAEQTKGRVFFTGGKDLDRYVVWDYVNRRKQIIS